MVEIERLDYVGAFFFYILLMNDTLIHYKYSFCIGLYACGTQGKIFYKQATWLAEKIGTLSNPIINCLTCMSSLWGIVFT